MCALFVIWICLASVSGHRFLLCPLLTGQPEVNGSLIQALHVSFNSQWQLMGGFPLASMGVETGPMCGTLIDFQYLEAWTHKSSSIPYTYMEVRAMIRVPKSCFSFTLITSVAFCPLILFPCCFFLMFQISEQRRTTETINLPKIWFCFLFQRMQCPHIITWAKPRFSLGPVTAFLYL